MDERKEGWMRIVVGIISGIILHLWGSLVCFLMLINFIIVIFKGKRNQRLAEFSETWSTQLYSYLQYMTFMTNYRPFPFNDMEDKKGKFEK